VIPDLEIRRDDRKLLAGTYGRGVWEIELEAAVAVGASPEAPSRNLLLDRPYPYPADGQVTFRFAARSQDPIELFILDVRGRVVDRVLARSPGDGVVRQVSWSVADLPAGVYFASLRAGTERMSRKLLIAR
jgi:hypothetical protein